MARALVEYNPETEAFAPAPYEIGASRSLAEVEAPEVLSETDEMELAASLLEVTSESELDTFLSKLLHRLARDRGTPIHASSGQVLGRILKSVAKRVLPLIGPGVGTVGGIPRPDRAAPSARHAGELFGLELEGLSPEDQEFETARSFVRFAEAVAKNVAGAPPSASPRAVAQAAAIKAARRHAPGLLSSAPAGPAIAPSVSLGSCSAGRWVRQGRNIFIVNC